MKTANYQNSSLLQDKKNDLSGFLGILATVLAMASIGIIVFSLVGLVIKNPAYGAEQLKVSATLSKTSSIERQVPVLKERLSLAELEVLRDTVNQSHLKTEASLLDSKRTREMVIAEHKANPTLSASNGKAGSKALQKQPLKALGDVYHSFSFYDATSRLYEDLDYDGFYQTFGVSFDADVETIGGSDSALVFAELYLSQDGGPWVHYFTTENFFIHGNSTQDDYEVLTTLNAGYDMDHYDVLIDLYEVGYGDIVASISSNETDSLYALPLESSELDSPYVEVIVVEEVSGGALSVLIIFTLAGYAVMRRRKWGS